MTQEALDSRIERYQLNRMNSEERSAFEAEIASHPDIRAEVELQRLLIGAVRHARSAQVKQTLASDILQAAREEKRARSGFRMPSYAWMATAAVVLAAILSAVFIIRSGRSSSDIHQDEKITLNKTSPALSSDSAVVMKSAPIIPDSSSSEISYAVTSKNKNSGVAAMESVPQEEKVELAMVPDSAIAGMEVTLKDTTLQVAMLSLRTSGFADSTSAKNAENRQAFNLKTQKIHLIYLRSDKSRFGYTFKNNTLKVYGLDKDLPIKITGLDGIIYIISGRNAYSVHPSAIYVNFEPETSPGILSRLGL
jgi:hypothetical protein